MSANNTIILIYNDRVINSVSTYIQNLLIYNDRGISSKWSQLGSCEVSTGVRGRRSEVATKEHEDFIINNISLDRQFEIYWVLSRDKSVITVAWIPLVNNHSCVLIHFASAFCDLLPKGDDLCRR